MNNDINERNIKMTIDKDENKCKTPIHKINIITHDIKENGHENKNINNNNNINNKNKLFYSPIFRRKSGYLTGIKNILEQSYKRKRSNNFEEDNSKLQKIKTLKEKSNNNINREKEIYMKEPNLELHKKNSNRYDNSNNNFKNGVKNLLQFTSNLYENDEHLNKGIITKKIDMNNFPNSKKNNLVISGGSIFQKKKLIISFGLNDQSKDISLLNNKNCSFKRKVSNISNRKITNEQRKKNSFSNFLKLKKIKSPTKEMKEISNNNNNNKMVKYSNIPNNDGDFTYKKSKYDYLRAKTIKSKRIIGEKILEEIESVKYKKKNSKAYNSKSKIIDTNKNETNDLIDSKKESPQNKPKNKKCYSLCFYNCKFNDDSEVN